MKRSGKTNKLLSIILVIATILSCVACSKKATETTPYTSDSTEITEIEKTEVENTEIEATEVEKAITEFITKEVYLEEFVVAEEEISELLVSEEQIDEVLSCKTIYVPEEHIEDFSEHSQTAQLFGEKVDIKPVLMKLAIGTGVIVTLTVLKKAGMDKPIFNIVAAAADSSLKFSKTGAVVGSVFGAFTGAADEIDKSGRTAAIAGFALATVGLIITAVSLLGAVPSAGTSGFGVAEGVHLVWAGIKFTTTAIATTQAARQTVKAFTSTEASEIDWNNINWDKVGVAAAQKAIQNGADGYMWGSIYGAIDGATQKYYEKFSTPYTQYQNRLKMCPKDGPKGHWTGVRGESDYVLSTPKTLPNGTVITKVNYQNAVPDFSPYSIAEVKIPKMTDERYIKGGNFDQADQALAEHFSKIKYNGQKTWTADDIKVFRENYPVKLTWHELSNMETMQLVPFEVNDTFGHYGGVAEYKAMVGQTGEVDYD